MGKREKDLSVSIVSYKDYDEISETVRSIEENTPSKISKEIYIVDNAATETDKEKIKEFNEKLSVYPDVFYMETEGNVGFSKAHNAVLSKINSRYHAIINPDIIVPEDVFSKIIDFMDKEQSVGMVIPRLTDENGNLLKVYRKELTKTGIFVRLFKGKLFSKRYNQDVMADKDYSQVFDVPFGQGSFLVIRTELYKQIGGFDENFFLYVEDADLCKRVNQVSRLVYFPDATVIHKWKKESHKNRKLRKIHLKSLKYYFRKWGNKRSS